MKSTIATLLLNLGAFSVSAFTPILLSSPDGAMTMAHFSSDDRRIVSSSALASDKPNNESSDDNNDGGLDLDLGEMFEMFDAADKEESFDEAIKKVKKAD
jgi:hypothetical protein